MFSRIRVPIAKPRAYPILLEVWNIAVATEPSLLHVSSGIAVLKMTYIGAISDTSVRPPATRPIISSVSYAGHDSRTYQSVLNATSNNAHKSARQKGQSSCRMAIRMKLILGYQERSSRNGVIAYTDTPHSPPITARGGNLTIVIPTIICLYSAFLNHDLRYSPQR
jgi:hypothetical protein